MTDQKTYTLEEVQEIVAAVKRKGSALCDEMDAYERGTADDMRYASAEAAAAAKNLEEVYTKYDFTEKIQWVLPHEELELPKIKEMGEFQGYSVLPHEELPKIK